MVFGDIPHGLPPKTVAIGSGRNRAGRVARSIHRETRLVAHALLDDHWPTVKRLVEALCTRPLGAVGVQRRIRQTMAYSGHAQATEQVPP